jgi:hypothetical protein
MLINRRHFPWALFVLIATAVCAVLYFSNFQPERLPANLRVKLPPFFGEVPPKHNTIGGTPLGILFGLAALAIFVFAMLLNVRKKVRTWTMVGHVQFWLRGHIWLTILTIPLVLFHSGFRLGGQMTTLLMWLYAIVMVSGFLGLALQQFMPHLMMVELPREIVFDQIPYVRGEYLEKAQTMRAAFEEKSKKAPSLAAPSLVDVDAADAKSGGTATTVIKKPAVGEAERQLIAFLDDDVIPYLKPRKATKYRLNSQEDSEELFRLLKMNVPDDYHPAVEEIRGWCEDRRLMDKQTRLQHWLHGWLLIHVPISFLLLILTVWHAVATLYFF